MKAIILAGGQGSRLRPVSGGLPKPMMPLCGRPLLEHIINLLARQGFRELCLTLGYRPDVIREHFGSGKDFGVSITYQVEETPLGTAGGVRQCAHFYGNEDFLVISGDAACDFDLSRLMAHHREHRCAATLALTRCRVPLRFGLVPTDETGRVLAFLEKPTWERVVTDQVNTGIYALSPRAMAPVPEGRPFDFGKELFPLLLEQNQPLHGLAMEGYWCDIGTPEEYFRCNLDALAGRLRLPEPLGPPPPPKTEAPAPRRPAATPGGVRRTLTCRERAAAMGLVTRCLAEFGPELTEGLRLSTREGIVRIAPDSGTEALEVEAPSPGAAARWAGRIQALLRQADPDTASDNNT